MIDRNAIAALERWFLEQCEGDWEHSHSIEIGTTDNPGWAIAIEVGDTPLESKPLRDVNLRRSKTDWVECWRYDDAWQADCGLFNLEEAIGCFLDWADAR